MSARTRTPCIVIKNTDLSVTTVVSRDGREWSFESLTRDGLIKFMVRHGLKLDRGQKGASL